MEEAGYPREAVRFGFFEVLPVGLLGFSVILLTGIAFTGIAFAPFALR